MFTALAEGASPAQAVRRAQLELIKQRYDFLEANHPVFWAAFTATGH
jgi:CHAT domain-containing protein